MKQHEYRLLEAISEDDTVTQSRLATHLGIAVGSVNWYIKRLIGRGYLKATRMDRTRLRYNLTSEGMNAFKRNATQYVRDSLKVYHVLRQQAKALLSELVVRNIESIAMAGEEPELDIFRLTCLEAGVDVNPEAEWHVRYAEGEYLLEAPRG